MFVRKKAGFCLEFRVAGRAREGQHVADVGNTGEVHDHAFKAHAEASMLDGAVLAQFQIPPVVLGIEAELFHACGEYIQTLFTLAAAAKLADGRNQKVGGANGAVELSFTSTVSDLVAVLASVMSEMTGGQDGGAGQAKPMQKNDSLK